MNRHAIVGLVLLLAGLGFGITGYQKTQPTGLENTLDFAARLAGQQVPSQLRRDKSDAYMMIAAGIGLFAAGVGLILRAPRET